VGKSTLLNVLVGEKLSIVTAKAQTTRQRLLGIYSDEGHQAAFVDTPGLLEPRYLLQEAMLEEARQAIGDADLMLYVADVGFERSLEHARAYAPREGLPALLCLNKCDRLSGEEVDRLAAAFADAAAWDAVYVTVATTGQGVGELRTAILGHLPESPPLYPLDELSTAPVRYFAAELIRETCFEQLGKEVPYSIAVEVEEYREDGDPVYIAALVYVERNSQKGIVIGSGGRMIRSIGQSSRRKIEDFIGGRVYLDLRVKVMTNWRRRPSRLKLLGYPPPAERG
jgi:GTP-binding protein Era